MGVANLVRGALKPLPLRPVGLLSPEEGGRAPAILLPGAFQLPRAGSPLPVDVSAAPLCSAAGVTDALCCPM